MMDKGAQGYLEMSYCPTEHIWAKISTKTIQGKTYIELQVEIINFPFYYEDNGRVYEDVENISGLSKKNTYMQSNETKTQ